MWVRRGEQENAIGLEGCLPEIPPPGLSDKVSNILFAAALPLETKLCVLHLIAGTQLLINLSGTIVSPYR